MIGPIVAYIVVGFVVAVLFDAFDVGEDRRDDMSILFDLFLWPLGVLVFAVTCTSGWIRKFELRWNSK